MKMLMENPEEHLERLYKDSLLVSGHRRPITPKSLAQKEYVDAIRHNDIVFAIGPGAPARPI